MGASLGEAILRIKADVRGANQGIDSVVNRMQRAGDQIRGIGTAMSMAGAGMAFGLKKIFGAGIGFEALMAEVRAVRLEMTDKEFAEIQKSAQELGRTTRFSATEAAEGFLELARKGLPVKKMLSSIVPLLNLATISKQGLGKSADVAAALMQKFGVEGKDFEKILAQIAVTLNNSSADFTSLTETLKTALQQVGGTKVTFAEISAATGTLANQMIKGSVAGSGLRRMLSILRGPSKKAHTVLATLGLTAREINPEFNSLTEILHKLNDAGGGAFRAFDELNRRGVNTKQMIEDLVMAGASENQILETLRKKAKAVGADLGDLTQVGMQAGAMFRLFGSRAAGIVTTLGGQIAKYDELVKKTQNASDEHRKMAAIMNDVVKYALVEIKSRIEAINIKIFTLMRKELRRNIDTIRDFLDKVLKWIDAHKELVKRIFSTAMAVTALLITVGPLLMITGSLVKNVTLLTSGLVKLVSVMFTLKGILTVGIIGALAVLGMHLYKNRTAIANWVKGFKDFDSIRDGLRNIGYVFGLIKGDIQRALIAIARLIMAAFGEKLEKGITFDQAISKALDAIVKKVEEWVINISVMTERIADFFEKPFTAERLKNTLKETGASIKEWSKETWEDLKEWGENVKQLMQEDVANGITLLREKFPTISSALEKMTTAAEGVGTEVLRIFTEAAKGIGKFATDVATSEKTTNTFKGIVTTALFQIGESAQSTGRQLKESLAVLGGGPSGKSVSPFSDKFLKGFEVFGKVLEGLITVLGEFYQGFLDTFGPLIREELEGFFGLITPILASIKEDFKEFFGEFGDFDLAGWARSAGEFLATLLIIVVRLIGFTLTLMAAGTKAFTAVWVAGKQFVTWLGGGLLDGIREAVDTAKDLWGNFKEVYGGVWESIKTNAGAALDFVVGAIETAVSKSLKLINKLKDAFNITFTEDAAIDKVQNGLGSALSNAVGGILNNITGGGSDRGTDQVRDLPNSAQSRTVQDQRSLNMNVNTRVDAQEMLRIVGNHFRQQSALGGF